MLKQADIAHYLLSLELVKPSVVAQEELTVVDVSRRNCVYLAMLRGGPTFVVKQSTFRDDRALAHEAAVLRMLGQTRLSGQAPMVVHHEPDAARLVLRTPGEARNWNEHQRAAQFPHTQARVLGKMLADLHALPADRVDPLPPGFDPMWGLSLPEPPHRLLLDLSTGAQDLVARLQANEALCDRLADVAAVGFERVLVHGDLRWDNCLAVAAGGSRRRTRLLVVDWELAGYGAAAFDVGTVVADYLRAWLESIPIVDPTDPSRFAAQARHPLRRIQPAVREFWSAYALASGHPPALERVMELSAVRVLQIAVEEAQALPSPSAYQVTLVQLADNMLRHTDDAVSRLLGLEG